MQLDKNEAILTENGVLNSRTTAIQMDFILAYYRAKPSTWKRERGK